MSTIPPPAIPRRRFAALPEAARTVLLAGLAAAAPLAASAQISLAPGTVTVPPGGTSAPISATITHQPPNGPGSGTLLFGNGFPAGVTTLPTPVTFTYAVGSTTSATSFRLAVDPSVPPGQYSTTVSTTGVFCGQTGGPCFGTLNLRVQQTGFQIEVSPPSVTLQVGAAPQTVTVTTVPASGLTGAITYTFSGLPAGVTFGGPQNVAAPYPPLAFPFSAAAGTPPGSYVATLTGSLATTPPVVRSSQLTVVVQRPDLLVSFAQPAMSVCDGGPAVANSVLLQPAGGYAGTPQISFANVPAGLTVTPTSPASPPLPPGASVPFTVAAAGAAPGAHPLNVRVQDLAAGIDKLVPLTVTVTARDFSPALAPAGVTLQAGGPPATVLATVGPNPCFTAPAVGLSVSGQPPGLTVSPAPATFAAPAYAAVSLTVAAQPTTPVGSHLLTATFTPTGGTARSLILPVTVTPAPDFTLAVVPPVLSLQAGSQAQVTVTSTALNGFAGSVAVAAGTSPGVVLEPAAFTLPGAGSQVVTVRAPLSAPPTSTTIRFEGTATGVVGPRSATLALTVTPAPPSITSIAPPALAAGSIDVVLRVTGERFRPGARVVSASPSLLVGRTTYLSASAVDVVVSAPTDAAPGSYRLDLVNADGGSTAGGAQVLVYPADCLGAPLGVTAVAIVHPLPYTLLAEDVPVRPRGLLATTGVGVIVGSWQLDGFPFDRFTVPASGGLPVEVRATAPVPVTFTGEHRLELVVEQPRTLASAPVAVIQAPESRTRLRLLAPAPDGPRQLPEEVRWTLVPGASGFLVEVASGDGELILRRRLSAAAWRPSSEDLAEIGPGERLLRVRAVFPGEVLGDPTPWQLVEVAGEPPLEGSSRWDSTAPERAPAVAAVVACGLEVLPAQAPSAGEGDPAGSDHRDLDLALMATVAGDDVEDGGAFDSARGQATTTFEVSSGGFTAKGTGDLSARQSLEEPLDSANESRNWDLLLGAGDERYRAEARGGYSPPDFLDQTEMLSMGLARRGVAGKAVTPFGSLSYYRTLDDLPVGYGYSPFITPTDVQAAGWELPASQRLLLRAFALRAESDPAAATQSTSEAVGVFGRVALGGSHQVVFELARARLESGDDPSRTGDAFRLGVTGTAGRFSYAVTARKTDAEFLNPVNPGFTVGAVSDRVGGDVSLSTTLGHASVTLQVRRLESGGDDRPRASEDNGMLSLFVPLSQRVTLQAGATLVRADGEADESCSLPASDRTARGLTFTLAESFGAASLSQGVFWQEVEDRALPHSDQEVVGSTLSGSFAPGPRLSLNGMVSATRTDAAPEIGRTDQFMVSLQATWTVAAPNVSLTPRGTYSRSESRVPAAVTEGEQYQLVLQWTPPWLGSLLAIEVAGDLTRSLSTYAAGIPPFQRRITASLTLRHSARLPVPVPPLPDPAGTGGADPVTSAWRL